MAGRGAIFHPARAFGNHAPVRSPARARKRRAGEHHGAAGELQRRERLAEDEPRERHGDHGLERGHDGGRSRGPRASGPRRRRGSRRPSTRRRWRRWRPSPTTAPGKRGSVKSAESARSAAADRQTTVVLASASVCLELARADHDVHRVERRGREPERDAGRRPLPAAQREREPDEARREERQLRRREPLVQERGRQQHHQRGIGIEKQRHQPGRGVVQRGEEARRLPHVADRAHADGHRERPAARPGPAA